MFKKLRELIKDMEQAYTALNTENKLAKSLQKQNKDLLKTIDSYRNQYQQETDTTSQSTEIPVPSPAYSQVNRAYIYGCQAQVVSVQQPVKLQQERIPQHPKVYERRYTFWTSQQELESQLLRFVISYFE